jgi:hypothetical protein
MCSISQQMWSDERQTIQNVSKNIYNVSGLIFKMTDDSGRWRMRIPITDLKDIDIQSQECSSYSDTLDREQFKLYSMLVDLGIDYKTIDEKYYQYTIVIEKEYLYCYAYTESCVRAGMVHYIKKFCSNLDKITLIKGIQYNIHTKNKNNNNINEEDVDDIGGSLDIFNPTGKDIFGDY